MQPNYGTKETDAHYAHRLGGEGEYWDNYIADRLLNHDEIPGSVDFRVFFTQFSRKHNWGPPCLGPIAINFREREIRYLLTHATQRRGMRVLDLGCGAGWLSLELARQGAHVTALDISRTNLALGRHMFETNKRNFPYLYQRFAGLPCTLEKFGSVEYLYGDLNNITLPTSEFDAVVVWDSLHHIPNLERLLAEVRNSLKPGGIFLGVDHAFATPKTVAYNDATVPWLKELLSWAHDTQPNGFYAQVGALFQQWDWGVLGVDYNVHPISGFQEFEAQLRDEMLEIIRAGLKQEALEKLESPQQPERAEKRKEEISPFEDVSAERLMQTLVQEFKVERFQTICPLIMPEQHFPAPESEAERLFQHHLSAMLVEMNERAVNLGQTDGQWFLFHLTQDKPTPTEATAQWLTLRASRTIEEMRQAAQHEEDSERYATEQAERIAMLEGAINEQRIALGERHAYIELLEAEVARKNDALASLSAEMRRLESELAQARRPRLPWKRNT